ncbi:hypothetical protein Pmani_032420 [Petrolisthes manimaculis]|uniref:Carbohydrate sulfotransferase n=1 Tax=Petrolisthes manimaculis TaxID=1843537 RepID=A0AAE1NT66_9EUCA|nr:hypothetical protein Pmani_032420 [Petrolisthes manimaculis]
MTRRLARYRIPVGVLALVALCLVALLLQKMLNFNYNNQTFLIALKTNQDHDHQDHDHQDHFDIQQLTRRAEHLRRTCQSLGLSRLQPITPISSVPILDRKGIFTVCVGPKVGKKWWRILGARAEEKGFANVQSRLPAVISVQHPLSRLAQCYREKFLGGKNISQYAVHPKRGGESWTLRWKSYWLPALISTGKISHGPLISKLIQTHRRHANMTPSHTLMATLITQAYGHMDALLLRTHSDVAFTFEEFLHHVVWTHVLGLHDPNWTSQFTLCQPCDRSYDYVSHLENSEEEVNNLLKVADVKGEFRFVSSVASEKGKKEGVFTDLLLYGDIAKHVMDQIFRLYHLDFVLFDYSTKVI